LALEPLDRVPRIPLAQYPTPLEHLPRLSAELRREVYVKRDDVIGPAMGGNKVRKLEYLLADAQARGAQRIVTFGGLQSNHCRMTAAAARGLGMEPHLFFFERRPKRLVGNLLLDQLVGARTHFVPLGGAGGGMTLRSTNRLVSWLARLRVGRHYFIPVGGHSWRGCLGYVRAAVEIDAQAKSAGVQDAWLVVAAGTGGTLAGLLAGLGIVGSSLRPLGIDVGNLWKEFPAAIADMASELCRRLDRPAPFAPQQVPLIQTRYVGPGYAKVTPEGLAAIRRLAQLEGLLLDPVYTAKAFAGLLDRVERGLMGREDPVIFLHTGGVPGLFAFDGLI
jgi:L-cysteate sulfo-lyase